MKKLDILLIEDELIWQIKIEEQLTSLGFEHVQICADINSARNYLQYKIPDLVVSDIMFGGKTIFEIFEEENVKRIPFLFITSSECTEFFQKASECKTWNYIVKPFHSLTLCAAIQTLMAKYTREIPKAPQGIKLRGRNGQKVIVAPEDVVFIKVSGNYSLIRAKMNQYMLKLSIKKLMEQLGSSFLRINRNYVVRKPAIKNLLPGKAALKVTTNEVLPIGRRFKKSVEEYFTNRMKTKPSDNN